jgi:hypothetical protein
MVRRASAQPGDKRRGTILRLMQRARRGLADAGIAGLPLRSHDGIGRPMRRASTRGPPALFCRAFATYRKNVEDRAIRHRTSSAFAKWATTGPAGRMAARIHPFG